MIRTFVIFTTFLTAILASPPSDHVSIDIPKTNPILTTPETAVISPTDPPCLLTPPKIECCICGDKVLIQLAPSLNLFQCPHREFHSSCIRKWIHACDTTAHTHTRNVKRTCPLCRQESDDIAIRKELGLKPRPSKRDLLARQVRTGVIVLILSTLLASFMTVFFVLCGLYSRFTPDGSAADHDR